MVRKEPREYRRNQGEILQSYKDEVLSSILVRFIHKLPDNIVTICLAHLKRLHSTDRRKPNTSTSNSSPGKSGTMFRLSQDDSFHYEILRTLSHARYNGADVGEVLEAASAITAGNMESFYEAFNALAIRANSQAEAINSIKHPVSARDAFFRAATYFRAADFYLHGNPDDERINDLWSKQLTAFDKAIALLPIPGERVILHASDGAFDIPAIFYRAHGADAAGPRPTLILGNGYDGAQEEMLHVTGFAALERGFNVITYEGPGQPTIRRQQSLGFIHQWEKVVSPVVDYLLGRPEVDGAHIGLMGYSMGGWLAVRAAAFEHRLAAVFAVDGVFDVFQAYSNQTPPAIRALLEAGDMSKVDDIISDLLASGKAPTALRWGIEQGIWSFNASGASDFVEKTRGMSLEGIAHQVKCPVWVGCAADDLFFQGQPEMLRDALGDRATYRRLTAKDGAGNHCHVGAMALVNGYILDWFNGLFCE